MQVLTSQTRSRTTFLLLCMLFDASRRWRGSNKHADTINSNNLKHLWRCVTLIQQEKRRGHTPFWLLEFEELPQEHPSEHCVTLMLSRPKNTDCNRNGKFWRRWKAWWRSESVLWSLTGREISSHSRNWGSAGNLDERRCCWTFSSFSPGCVCFTYVLQSLVTSDPRRDHWIKKRLF